jgi:hypothetical protein
MLCIMNRPLRGRKNHRKNLIIKTGLLSTIFLTLKEQRRYQDGEDDY